MNTAATKSQDKARTDGEGAEPGSHLEDVGNALGEQMPATRRERRWYHRVM